jgi:hypothetical protein
MDFDTTNSVSITTMFTILFQYLATILNIDDYEVKFVLSLLGRYSVFMICAFSILITYFIKIM